MDGKQYPTVEHFFQANKCADPAEAAKIRKLATPYQAKREGQRVKLRKNWDYSSASPRVLTLNLLAAYPLLRFSFIIIDNNGSFRFLRRKQLRCKELFIDPLPLADLYFFKAAFGRDNLEL